MSEMVDRVAKAIYGVVAPQMGLDDSWEGLADWAKMDGYPHASHLHELMLAEARAAIEAMREPTQAMNEAGDLHAVSFGLAAEVWAAMIDTALSD